MIPDASAGLGRAPSEPGIESATDAEKALVARARVGEREAFERIVREHASAVYGVVLGFVDPHEADDVAQDVFLKVVQGLPSFDGKSRLGTWIYRIATNAGLNALRTRKRRRTRAGLSQESHVPSREPSPEAELHAREEEAALARALETLPEEFRAVVVLRVHRGLSFEEIARVLGIQRPTAESRMARAKDKLRGMLGPWLDRVDEPAKVRR